MRIPRVVALALAVCVLGGCGGSGGKPAAAAPAKQNAAAYDTVDVCKLPTDTELQAALGEAPGERSNKDDDSLKACAVDGSSGRFYLFITVRRSPAGGQQQYDYDRSVANEKKDVDSVGMPAFSYRTDNEAGVEALDGDLVLRVALVFYLGGGQVSDAPELTGRMAGLVKQLVQKV